jgi:chromosome partitioning protein
MMAHETSPKRAARVIVVGNEKGGSGKSTVAMHVSIALMKSGHRVATIDLDTEQRSFTNYIENRRNWARRVERELEMPDHLCIEQQSEDEGSACTALTRTVDALAQSYGFIVIDTPGHGGQLNRLAHSMADTLITPLNDSFVDFDVLGTVDPETFAVSGDSHYSRMVAELRRERSLAGGGLTLDWVVLRNRLSMLGTRNKRLVGDALQELARRLEFRAIEGFAERMIFREFFPRGLTALDYLDEATLGTRPTMSHVTARQEVASLIAAIGIDSDQQTSGAASSVTELPGQTRDVA